MKSLRSYDLGSVLGEGATCTVRKSIDRRSGEACAVKLFKAEAKQECFENEVRALTLVKHPNVIRLIERIDPKAPKAPQAGKGSGKTDDCGSCLSSSSSSPVGSSDNTSCESKIKRRALVLPLAPNGDVLSHLLTGGAFNAAVTRTIFRQLLLGLGACHDAGIIHRDLKPDNLLFDDNFLVLISDFGFSKRFRERRQENGKDELKFFDDLGSRGYVAPEIGDAKGYGKECDLWSLGVTLFIMRTGRPPYASESQNDFWFNLLIQERYNYFWKAVEQISGQKFEENLKDLVNKLLCPSPKDRSTIEEALKHSWMNEGILLSQQELADAMRNHNVAA